MAKFDNLIEELKACVPGLLLVAFVLGCGWVAQYLDGAPEVVAALVRSTK